MDTETEVVYRDTVTYKESKTRKTFKCRKSLFLRSGIILILFLTSYVLFTFYNQLMQASQLLLEIKQRSIALNVSDTLHLQKIAIPGEERKINEEQNNEFDDIIFDRILDFAKAQNDSQFSEHDLGQAIRRRFQENVYMIRKRFYESHQSKTFKTNVGRAHGLQMNTEDAQQNTKVSEVNQIHAQNSRGAHAKEENTDNGAVEESQSVGKDLNSTRGSHEARVDNLKVFHQTSAKVIIVAYHRSGSSFLGEMFNRNPNAFYLFEPIHTIDSFLDARRRFPVLYDTLIRNLLDNIFKCDFNKHPLYVNTLTSSPFRLKSEALSSKLCDPRANANKMHLCQRINATRLGRLCSSRTHTIVKTIRMAHWENLDFLTDSPHTSLKVIHLVRDPRGIIASRVSWLLARVSREQNSTSRNNSAIRMAIAKYIRIISISLCQQMAKDINDWTKRAKFSRSYAMVRYEDVSRQPLTVYKEISEFADVAQSQAVIGWLKKNTKHSDFNYYSTTRNSSAAPHMWRRRLTMSLVNEIQNNCAQVMDILGYKLVHSKKELRDTNVPLVVNWNKKGFLRKEPYL